jgi:zinc protease
LARNGASFSFASIEQRNESRSADITYIGVRPLAGDWEKAVAEVRAVLADAMKSPPSQADIERELVRFSDFIRKQQDSYPFEAAATQVEEIVRAVDIRETVAAPGTVTKVFEALRPKFTPQRVLEATRALFTADATRIFLSAPAAVPSAETRLAKALTAPVANIKNVRLAQSNVGFDKLPKLGSPGKVVATQKFEKLGMDNIEFANGTRALLFPNEAEDQQVRVLVRFGRGFQSVAPASNVPFWSGPMVIGQNGIGKLDRTKLNELMNGRRLELTFDVDNDAFEFSATTRPEDLADQLTLIATQMDFPGWLSAPVERAKALAASDYDSYEMSAMAVMQRDLQYLITSKDARWKAPTPEDIKALTPKSFRAFWEPMLASGPVEVLVFGDFKRDDAVAALQKSFGAMKKRGASLVPVGADASVFPTAAAAPVQLTHKGPKDQTAAVIAWPTGAGLAGISEGRELEVLAAVFRNRLMEKFRSEQGASYSPNIGSRWPDDFRTGGYLLADSQVQPQDVDRFYATVAEVAADLKQNPVSADELQRAVEPMRQYIERFSSGNMFWLLQMEGATYQPARFSALGRLFRDYSNVTPDRVLELARRYFRDDKAWKLVVTPAG